MRFIVNSAYAIVRGMKNEAVPQRNILYPAATAVLLSLLAICLLTSGAGSAAAAKKKVIGNDGRVYACYKVAGKPQGAVRLVPRSGKCRRGERKVSWSVQGPAGTQGSAGQVGSAVAGGAAGNGTTGVVALETKVLELSTELAVLKGILDGVDNEALTKALATVGGITNADLTGALGKLSGISGTDLQEAVGSVPAVQLLCGQADTLTDTFNALRTGIGNIEVLGIKLPIGGLPGALTEFTCQP